MVERIREGLKNKHRGRKGRGNLRAIGEERRWGSMVEVQAPNLCHSSMLN